MRPNARNEALTTQTTIRPAQIDDYATIGTIAETTNLFPASALDDMISGYKNKAVKDIWFVAERSGLVVSFGFCEPERATDGTWNLLAIGVDPNRQGQGIGAKMMAYIERELRGQDQRILLVETMGTDEFALTRSFYKKCGYTEEACIREFYEPGGDKIVFWKQL